MKKLVLSLCRTKYGRFYGVVVYLTEYLFVHETPLQISHWSSNYTVWNCFRSFFFHLSIHAICGLLQQSTVFWLDEKSSLDSA